MNWEVEEAEGLESLEESAALGGLLSFIGHEINNHLTNLLLATECVRNDPCASNLDLLAGQTEKTAKMVASVQDLASVRHRVGAKRNSVGPIVRELADWDGFGRRPGVRIDVELDPARDDLVEMPSRHLLLALALLVRSLPPGEDDPVLIRVASEEVERSPWSTDQEKVAMVVIRLSRPDGTDAGWPPFQFADLTAGFLDSRRSPREIGVMAAWEVLRKAHGRPSARLGFTPRSGDRPAEIVVSLPVPLD